ncbi:MAG: glycosyltransferase family 39 protein [Acidobacteria bacterium]|nr:glycosyltransferase family 39 protein [Acidobacteriota bacterium]
MNDQSQATPKSAFRIPPSEIAAAIICLLYLGFLVYFSRQHPFGTYATETDFYHLYAPDAARIAAGQFPLNDFQGPGYPVLLSLITKYTGDVFIAGKWISIISAVLCVWMMFVLFKQLFGNWVGVGAAILSTVMIEFPEFSLQATTDVFFLLICLVALVIFTGSFFSLRMRLIYAAFITSIAYLTRYNGLFLLGCFLFALLIMNYFEQSWRERWLWSAIFVAVFFLTALPWFIANYRHNGSPFYNANYLNMATMLYPELVGGDVVQDGTRKMREQFHSFGDVLGYNPKQAVSRYFSNLSEVFLNSLRPTLVTRLIGWLGLIGLFVALLEIRLRGFLGNGKLSTQSKGRLLLFVSMAVYLLLMGLNHWEPRYFFFIGLCYSGLASYLAYTPIKWLNEVSPLAINRTLVQVVIPTIFILGIAAPAFTSTRESFQTFMQNHPYEIPAAAKFLQSQNAAPYSLKIVARKPHLPFMAKQEWVFFPQVKSLDELKAWLEKNPVDYIAVGKRELKTRKELTPLGDPKTAPDWLKAAWVNNDPKFILYKPNLK